MCQRVFWGIFVCDYVPECLWGFYFPYYIWHFMFEWFYAWLLMGGCFRDFTHLITYSTLGLGGFKSNYIKKGYLRVYGWLYMILWVWVVLQLMLEGGFTCWRLFWRFFIPYYIVYLGLGSFTFNYMCQIILGFLMCNYILHFIFRCLIYPTTSGSML